MSDDKQCNLLLNAIKNKIFNNKIKNLINKIDVNKRFEYLNNSYLHLAVLYDNII